MDDREVKPQVLVTPETSLINRGTINSPSIANLGLLEKIFNSTYKQGGLL